MDNNERMALLHEGIIFAETIGSIKCQMDTEDARFLYDLARRADLVPQWLPIETAPKDGSDLILWPGLRRPVAPAVGAWLDTKGGPCWYDLSVGHHNGLWKPTRWMPLPDAPKEAS